MSHWVQIRIEGRPRHGSNVLLRDDVSGGSGSVDRGCRGGICDVGFEQKLAQQEHSELARIYRTVMISAWIYVLEHSDSGTF